MLQHPAKWQQSLANAVTDPYELCRLLALDKKYAESAIQAVQSFRLMVPREFIARMEIGNSADPLLRQVLPMTDELIPTIGYTFDPLQELHKNPRSGILHKYAGRVLLILAGACAINCRYCFRRHFPYENNIVGRRRRQQIIEYLQADDSIEEVIYSGGEPLIMVDERLAELTAAIATVAHIKRLRIHTRLPVVIPSRINDELLAWLTATRLQTVVVVHINHAQEIDDEVRAALKKLYTAGILLLNQSVLLQGVNDSVQALVDLSRALISANVMPYYLHLLDKVAGANHFNVEESIAVKLIQQLREQVSGYMVPKLVKEIASESAKVSVG